jgi:hypothetical protein
MIESGESFAQLRLVDAEEGLELAIDILNREQVSILDLKCTC